MIYRFSSCILLILFIVFTLTGCGAYSTSPVVGTLVSDVHAPLHVGSGINKPLLKVGTGSASSVLGLFAFGDASIRIAATEAGIQQIYYVDYHTKNVLGIFSTFTVYVYGE